ncbi:MAG TPA: MDR family MFS transporter [Chloroflexia bacterium]|nr:MDR family MFS transporter [Chloroflexia bacterium]
MATSTATKGRTSAPSEATDQPQVKNLLVIMSGVLLGILLGALDQTIVGPAMPKIIGELNGFEHYAWVFTAYMLTSTVSVPIFGKLGDMYGRKWFYIGGIIVFLIGSMLCGIATDIWQLIGFRALQGLGGGIMFSNAFTIIGDLVPPAERGRWQGLFGGIWGLASVFGPTAGGYITDYLSWRWVFYVNLPVGLIALAVLLVTFPNMHYAEAGKKSIDWLGAATLTAAVCPLLVALSLGGTKDWAWGSVNTLGMMAVAAVFLGIFLFVESRAKEPIIPLDLFKNRTFTLSVIVVFLTGLGMFGAVSFIPLFIQAVQGDSATSSGNAVTPMMLSLVVSSVICGQLISRTGKYRVLGIVGMVLLTTGLFLLATMNVDTARWQTIGYMIIMGFGLGIAMPLYTLIVQNAFPMQRLGVVTSATTFFRSIGGTVGLALLGSIVNNRFLSQFHTELSARSPQVAAQLPAEFTANLTPQALVNPAIFDRMREEIAANGVPTSLIPQIIGAIQGAMKPALAVATTEAFLIGASTLVIAIVATAFLKEIPLRKRNDRPAVEAAEGANPESAQETEGVKEARQPALMH